MSKPIVIARETMLAELCCALLFRNHLGYEIILTGVITHMDEEMLKKIDGRTIYILGGYYRGQEKEIYQRAGEVAYVLNDCDEKPTCGVYVDCNACAYAIGKIGITDPVIVRIATYLDSYLYDYPDDDAMNFQNGVYTIGDGMYLSDKDKIIKVISDRTLVDECIERGKIKRVSNLRTAEQRLKEADYEIYTINGSQVPILVSFGDTPIVDSAYLLAKNSSSGLGLLVRFSKKYKKTMRTLCATKESGFKAGRVSHELFGGGGSCFLGGSSSNELKF